MADRCYEQYVGRLTESSLQNPSTTTIEYVVVMDSGDDEPAAFNVLTNPETTPDFAPTSYDGQRRAAARLTERMGPGRYRFEVDYENADSEKSPDDEKVVDEWTVSFSTSGKTQNINRGTAASQIYKDNSGTPFDADKFNRWIGLNADEESIRASGIDITIPQLRMNVDVKLAQATFTMNYLSVCANLTGKVNDAPFPPTKGGFYNHSFDAGEVLCLGVSGTSRKTGETTIGLQFAIEPNVVGLEIAPVADPLRLTPLTVNKEGWQAVWTWDVKQAITLDGKQWLVPTPLYAIVETVYPKADFSQFGLT